MDGRQTTNPSRVTTRLGIRISRRCSPVQPRHARQGRQGVLLLFWRLPVGRRLNQGSSVPGLPAQELHGRTARRAQKQDRISFQGIHFPLSVPSSHRPIAPVPQHRSIAASSPRLGPPSPPVRAQLPGQPAPVAPVTMRVILRWRAATARATRAIQRKPMSMFTRSAPALLTWAPRCRLATRWPPKDLARRPGEGRLLPRRRLAARRRPRRTSLGPLMPAMPLSSTH
jgi:hypothetical protein